MAFAQVGGQFPPIVGLYRDALRLPEANVVALIRHELGHVSAPTGSEQHADNVAHVVTGQPIRYDARRIQTIGPGTYPRPRSIHR
jgi:predicted Zn-dependent protease